MKTTDNPMPMFRISVGAYSDANFVVIDTNAPIDYDGFGTFTIAEYENERTVLVRHEHLDWQTIRYSSGNHWWRPTNHTHEAVTEAIWNRIDGRSQ